MPGLAPALTTELARDHISETCLAPTGDGVVGLEAEWHVFRTGDSAAVVDLPELREIVGDVDALPARSPVTFEPGGQVELSTRPGRNLTEASQFLADDHAYIAARLEAAGLELAAIGMDPVRTPQRLLREPRYAAMEAYFDLGGPEGRWMMSRTAAIQVNLDNGPAGTCERRWHLVHTMAPALIAAFANSPFRAGEPSGWKSTRLANWQAMDPTRTAPVGAHRGRSSWLDYALDARVMLIRLGQDRYEPLDGTLTFADWIERGHDLGHPTLDDLDYHLTTLFPPVRARGWLEVRYLDALPDPYWRVAAAVLTALLDDDAVADDAERAVASTAPLWCEASRDGLEHPDLRATAEQLFALALRALPRLELDAVTVDACGDFADRFVARGRCPADDLLDLVPASKEW